MPIDKLNAAITHALERLSPTRVPSAADLKIRSEVEGMAAEPATMETIQRAAAHLDKYMKSMGRQLEFKVDDESGRMVVSVRDSETGELIRQIPSEEVLRLARGMDTNSVLVSITA